MSNLGMFFVISVFFLAIIRIIKMFWEMETGEAVIFAIIVGTVGILLLKAGGL